MLKRFVILLLAAGMVIGFADSVASAKIIHEEVGTFNPEGYPMGVATDRSAGASAGDVYVASVNAESFASTVRKFTASGSFVCEITGTETPGPSECNGAAGSRTSLGSFSFISFSPFANSGVAVDSSGGLNSGDVYVADIAGGVIDKFSENGEFLCEITGTEAPGPKECNGAASSQTKTGGFQPTAVAVSTAGDVYVADIAHNVIDEFGPKGEYIEAGEVAGPEVAEPTELAIDSSGSLYIVDGGGVFAPGTKVVKYSKGAFTTLVEGSEPKSVAVDLSNGHVYAQNNSLAEGGDGRLNEYTPNGALLNTFTSTEEGFPGNIAVGQSGQIYDAVVQVGTVRIFSGDIVIPDVEITGSTGIQESTAIVNGEVSPDSSNGGTAVTECAFEYVTQAQFETSRFGQAVKASCAPATPYASSTVVSAELTGLAPSTTYHVRLAAANSNGHTGYSEAPSEEMFTTHGKPTIESTSSSAITRSGATLNAEIRPNGYETQYEFQYGETESYGSSAPIPAADIGSGEATVSVSQSINGLKTGTRYHYRVIARNARGTATGPDLSFTTAPVAAIEYQLTLAGPHTATIKARLDPKLGLPTLKEGTSCHLQYVTETQYEVAGYSGATEVPCAPSIIDPSSEGQNVMIQLAGLSTDTTYRYRLIAVNEAGEAGIEERFATFGIQAPFEATLMDQEGHPYMQAGGHPYEFVTKISFNSSQYAGGYSPSSGILKDVSVHLPVGMIGNPRATPKCTVMEAKAAECGPGTQVGVIRVTLENAGQNGSSEASEKVRPLYNVVPPKGLAAEFASATLNGGLNATISARVLTGEGYGISADSLNIPVLGIIKSVSVSMWGVPADPAHDAQRICPPGQQGTGELGGFRVGCDSGEALKAFLTTPTSCTEGKLAVTAVADSYQAPGDFVEAHTEMPGMEHCEMLRFTPSVAVTPESSHSDSATGLHVELHIPQEENAKALVQAELKEAVVTLPQGVTINPSGASGLETCSMAEIELNGPNPAKCPQAAKIGTVEIDSPLVDHTLKGAIYIGNQQENPFRLTTYLAVSDERSGVVLKLAGTVAPRVDGQLVTTFAEDPQLPFEDLKLNFFGGPHAVLATPRSCGTYTTATKLTPWSTPNSPVAAAYPFEITSGPSGTPCAAEGFAPSFTAGMATNRAGGFSPLEVRLTRNDGEQRFAAVTTVTPPGVSAILSQVPLCGEPEASVGDCPAASQIGHVAVTAGVGTGPIALPEAGRPQDPVYLTGPYGGAPFGLSIVVPAEAGPFNLDENGRPVVVRAAVHVDPRTAQVSIASAAIPQMLEGIPTDLRSIDVTIDRERFMLNPTNCEPMAVQGNVASAQGANASVSSRFQAAECRSLPFKPSVTAHVQAKTSKAKGSSLHVTVRSGSGQANVSSVHVVLPKKLPARLTTLNKACDEAQFNANPAGCPAASKVGTATARTPVLPVPLTGPAYFVSHGGAAFPDLAVVLQGYGVTIDLVGNTFISKSGVTSSTFGSVPDVPITRFDLTLPQGANSAFAASGNLCKGKMTMPTTIKGQNGAVIKQNTKIAVDGCPKAKKHAKKHHKRKRKK